MMMMTMKIMTLKFLDGENVSRGLITVMLLMQSELQCSLPIHMHETPLGMETS
jgi:hypothetical protein